MYADITLEHLAELYSAATGWEVDAQEMMLVGERVLNLQRMFNMRDGLVREDDQLHPRAKQQPAFGFYEKEEQCVIADFDGMLDEYYEARKWSKKTGIPSDEILKQLDLQGLV